VLPHPQVIGRTRGRVPFVALVCLYALSAGRAPPASADEAMAHMAGHMYMTTLRPLKSGDREKADALVASAKAAMAPYQDYHKALADGYKIFLPDVPQPQYHFTQYEHALEARSHFDPLKPTSLLYTKTPDGGYQLVGAMYTARVDATEDEINERIPLSVAHWHQHINFARRRPIRRPRTSDPVQNSVCSAPSRPRRTARPQAGSSILIFSGGWSSHRLSGTAA
jgi:hypothetical protein